MVVARTRRVPIAGVFIFGPTARPEPGVISLFRIDGVDVALAGTLRERTQERCPAGKERVRIGPAVKSMPGAICILP